jgi:hypothetical protein
MAQVEPSNDKEASSGVSFFAEENLVSELYVNICRAMIRKKEAGK